MTKTGTEQPRTAAGRTFRAVLHRTLVESDWEWVDQSILAIEAEAASPSREALAAALRAVRSDKGNIAPDGRWDLDIDEEAEAILAVLEAGER